MFQKENKKERSFLDWDQLGFWVSLVCGIHCVAMPFVLGVLPFTGSGETIHEVTEIGVLLVTMTVGTYAMTSGYRKHKNVAPTLFMIVGLCIIFTGMHLHTEMAEMILMPVGALGLAIAHLRNHRLLHLVK
jgi:hypothetical protein